MSSNVQFYGVDKSSNNISENYNGNARVFNQPYEQQTLSYSENRRSWNNHYVQSNNYYRDENSGQQPYTQPPPNSTNHGCSENVSNQRSYKPQHCEDQPFNQDYFPHRLDNSPSSNYHRGTTEKHWSQNHFGNDQPFERQNIESRMQNMQINEPYQPANPYRYEQSNQNVGNYTKYSNRPYHSPKQPQDYQNNSQQYSRPTYEHNSDQRNNFTRENDFPSSQQPSNKLSTYPERGYSDQARQPDIVAKTVNDGNEVAVFGVVAKLPPPPPGRPQIDNQPHHEHRTEETHQRPPPPRSPARTHHLTPISEQPFQPHDNYSGERDPGYHDHRIHEYSDDYSRNRYRSETQRPGPTTSYDRPYSTEGFDRFRDDYADSSGYGSTLTERSYEGQWRNPKPPHPQDNSAQRYRQPTDALPPQQLQPQQEHYPNLLEKAQPPIQRHDWNSSRADEMNRHVYGKAQNSDSGSRWPPEELARFRDYEQQNYQEYRSNDFKADERHQHQEVQEPRENFDRLGPNISVPHNPSSYGRSQYNDTRHVPLDPWSASGNDHSSSQPQKHSSHSTRSSTYPPPPQGGPQSSEEFHEATSSQQTPPLQYQPPAQQRYESQSQPSSDFRCRFTPPRQDDPHPPSTHQDRYQPPGRQNPDEDRYDAQYRPPLPYVDPPPQHSQSMSNLDNLQPEKRGLDVQRSGTRNSYSNPYSGTDSSMVVGVRFDRPPTHHSNGHQARPQPPQVSRPFSSNQDIRQSNHTAEQQQRVKKHEIRQYGRVYYGATTRAPTEPAKEEPPHGSIQSPPDQSPRRYDDNVQQTTHSSKTNQFNRNLDIRTSEKEDRVPNVVVQSYEKRNDGPREYEQQQQQHQSRRHLPPQPQQLQTFRDFEQFASQNPLPKREQNNPTLTEQTQPELSISSDETNYVPSVVAKSYRLLGQSENRQPESSVDDEWPAPPTGLGQPDQKEDNLAKHGGQVHQSSTTRSGNTQPISDQPRHTEPQGDQPQQQTRYSPTGGDNSRSYPQIPRHPFDPEDEDDSSEGIDVDADTPPPTSVQPSWLPQNRRELNQIKRSDQEDRDEVLDKSNKISSQHQRPAPAGEKHQQIRRQPGDGLNDEQSNQSYQQQRATASNAADRLTNKTQPLNHDLTREKPSFGKKENSTRKLRNRSESSTSESLSDFEITVTSSDLVQQGKPPIVVHQSTLTSDKPVQECIHSQVHAHKNIHPQNEATQTDLPYLERKSQESRKFVFKLPSEDAMKRQTAHPVPDVRKPTSQDRNKPVTSTDKGFGSSTKEKSSLESALREQFEIARENALRKEAKKQERVPKLAQVFTRMSKSKRSPSPAKQSTLINSNTKVGHNRDVVLKHSKDNADIYQQSKPKQNRERASDRSSTGKDHGGRNALDRYDDVRERDRGRSRTKERETSPGRRERSRERQTSPGRRGPSKSRDYIRSPDQKDQAKSRDRNRSPARRFPDRSKDKHVDREDRERPHRLVSPPRQRRDECPYPESQLHRREESPHYRRSDEPEWVERFRRKRATDDPESKDLVNDLSKEFDINEYERRVKRATSYNSDFEQPQRKQLLPTKLMAKGGSNNKPPLNRRPPPGNDEWIKDLKDHNRIAQENRR